MTAKPTASDGDGPGVRAHRANMRKWWKAGALYAVAATALIAILVLGKRDPAAGGLVFEPEAAIAGAVLLPILTSVTMWFCLRMSDEFQRRLIIDAWAASFIVVAVGIGGLKSPSAPDTVAAAAPFATPRAQGLNGMSFAQTAAGRTLPGAAQESGLPAAASPEIIDWGLPLPDAAASQPRP